MSIMVINLILFVFFGQKTVRKLRRNPDTKDALGQEFISGWDIINVMSALSLPRKLIRKFRETIVSPLNADADLLYRYTTRIDRILARVLYISMVTSASAMIILMVLDKFGIFK
jgi:hypothetical protein